MSNLKNDGFGSFTERTSPRGVEWMRRHPLWFAVGALLTVLAIVTLTILQGRNEVSTGTITAWGNANPVAPDSTQYESPIRAAGIGRVGELPDVSDATPGDAPIIIPTFIPASSTPTQNDTFNLEEFLRRFNASAPPSTAPTNGTKDAIDLIREAYSYVPSGLVGVKTVQGMRTETQEAIYTYGNEIGALIQVFEEKYPDTVAILDNQAKDRANPSKVAALEDFAAAMAGVGRDFLAMKTVPSVVGASHEALARSYITIGTNLALVAKTRSDADFLYAIEVYNKSVEAFTKEFVAMAALFGAYEVHFGSSDAGRVFTFTAVGY